MMDNTKRSFLKRVTRWAPTIGVLLLGLMVGYWFATHGVRPRSSPLAESASSSSGSSETQATASPSGELWLSDFETNDELTKRWKPKGVSATRVEEHAAHGRYAAKLVFDGSKEPAFKMENFLDSDPARSDWRPYKTLAFNLYNAGSKGEKLLLQVKDKDGKRYKEKLLIKGQSAKQVTIPLQDVGQVIDLKHVIQFNIFQWEPKGQAVLYFDALRLSPAGSGSSSPAPDEASAAGVSQPPVVGPEGDLWLSDFETEQELEERWETKGATVERVEEQATHGRFAAKVTFEGGGAPAFKIEDFLDSDTQWSNWKPYQALSFDVANAESSQQKLLLQLKDQEGRRYKKSLRLDGNASKHVTIPLAEADLDLAHVVQFNLFLWEPKSSATFYVDAVRLKRTAESSSGAGTLAAGHVETEPAVQVARAAITPNRLGGLRFASESSTWQTSDPATGQPIVRVPIELVGPEVPLSVGFSVSGGVPFAMGQLAPGTPVRLRDTGETIWPVQSRQMANWEDGSVKWLLVTTQVPPTAAGRRVWLEYGTPVSADPVPAPRVRVENAPDFVTVTTGPMRFTVSKERFRLFESAMIDRNGNGVFEESERLAGGGDLVVKHRNTEFRSSRDTQTYTLAVEESGPLRATLKASGWFRDQKGNGFCQFTVRIQAFAGLPQVRVYHTFIYTGYPANLYHHEYKEVKLPQNETIQDISLELPVTTASSATFLTADDDGAVSLPLSSPIMITQTAHDRYELLQGGRSARQGQHSEGWMLVQNRDAGVMVGVRDAWQQYPKAFIADPKAGRLVVKLWPESAGELDLQTGPEAFGPDDVARGSAFGLGKTHELVFGFLGASVEPDIARAIAGLWQSPWVLAADPAWLEATDAWGAIAPAPSRAFGDAEAMLNDLFAWAERQPKRFGWYGMLNYGDTLDWYRNRDEDQAYDSWGWHPVGRWGWFGCEMMGTHAGALTSFLRTRDLKYFLFGEASARHIMDVDTVHYNTVANDPRLSAKIQDTFSKVGSMHRHSAYHWSGRNEETSHTNVTGLLMYYYLTGYERAWDVANEVGGFFLLDPVTYTQHPDIAPARNLGNLLWGDVLMYQATGDARYKAGADRWAKVLVEGQRADGTWLETYNPRDRAWVGRVKNNYITFYVLQALIAYHRLTGDEAAAHAIVNGTDAMIAREQERQFFDALAYSYLLTGNLRYLEEGKKRLAAQMKAQQRTSDPLYDGMIFDKAIYERVPPVLYQVPYFLGALAAPDFLSLQNTLAGAARDTANQPTSQPASRLTELPTPQSYEVLIMPSAEKVLPEIGALKGSHKNPAVVSLARNEYEAVQLIVRSDTTELQQVTVEPGDLKQVNGDGVIPRTAVTWSPVGFVKTKEPGYSVSHVGLWPDPLPAASSFDVQPGWPQPIWLTVYAALNTPAGEYTGTVVIRPANAPAQPIQVNVTVWDFTLPATPSLKTAFDVYPNRLESAYSQFFPQWWSRWAQHPQELEHRFFEDLVRHRLAPIVNADLSDPNTLTSLQQLRGQGLSTFAVGRHGGSFDNNWPADPAQLALLEPVYRSYAHALREANLLDRHYIYAYDEPRMGSPNVAAVTQMLRQADPALKSLVVLEDAPEVESLRSWFEPIDIVCLRNVTFDPDQAQQLKQMGKELWLYVSGPQPPYPTLVIDYPAMASRILPWMCWKYGATGLLYWSVNYWTTNPYQDPMNTRWGQNGNGSLYYPGPDGPVPSIRLEVLRDGMEDYEYLHLLRQLVTRAASDATRMGDPALQSLVTRAQTLLAIDPAVVESMSRYTNDPQVIEQTRQEAARLIVALQDVLGTS